MSHADPSPFRTLVLEDEALGLTVDTSRIHYDPGFFEAMEPRMQRAYGAMAELEAGAIANPDEARRVGHYWLRAPERAPEAELTTAIEETLEAIVAFARDVHAARVRPERATRFTTVLVIGIGGSTLGPQFVSAALTSPADRMRVFFFDNTDPDGMDRTLDTIGDELARTLTVVISKSGGTKETRNGMLEAGAAYDRLGLDFARHAVAVTGADSELDKAAKRAGFLGRFPMWDWVGGRTSEMSAVGLLPAALQGLDVRALLAGARAMDEATRRRDTARNPAALLALAWFAATGGVGKKDMVVLPYKDRLELFSRYLQQLVMESLGKRTDRAGNVVHQGIAVYGNKGSTDQHAYVQQLRDGLDNFFVTFIEVLKDRSGPATTFEVDDEVTSGDYLFGFLHGTRKALWEAGRASLTLTLDDVTASSVGRLIALYERAVGLYASLVDINAYHQPGVEAGKKAASEVLALQARVVAAMRAKPGAPRTAQEVAAECDGADVETVGALLRHLAANGRFGLERLAAPSGDPLAATYRLRPR